MAADVFDQRHLIALYQRGLINELPIELGPMPVFDLGPSVDEDLKRWNIVDPSTNELTEPAQEYFAGLVGYEWAVWGIVLLYNQRKEIVSDLPDEFLQYGVQYAIRDVPRASFLIGYREGTFTTATLAAGQLALATDRARSNTDEHRNEAVGQIIMAILDPQKQWKPYPMERISIPATAAEALKRDRTDDTEDVLETTRDGLRDAGMARTTVRGLPSCWPKTTSPSRRSPSPAAPPRASRPCIGTPWVSCSSSASLVGSWSVTRPAVWTAVSGSTTNQPPRRP